MPQNSNEYASPVGTGFGSALIGGWAGAFLGLAALVFASATGASISLAAGVLAFVAAPAAVLAVIAGIGGAIGATVIDAKGARADLIAKYGSLKNARAAMRVEAGLNPLGPFARLKKNLVDRYAAAKMGKHFKSIDGQIDAVGKLDTAEARIKGYKEIDKAIGEKLGVSSFEEGTDPTSLFKTYTKGNSFMVGGLGGIAVAAGAILTHIIPIPAMATLTTASAVNAAFFAAIGTLFGGTVLGGLLALGGAAFVSYRNKTKKFKDVGGLGNARALYKTHQVLDEKIHTLETNGLTKEFGQSNKKTVAAAPKAPELKRSPKPGPNA